MDKDSALNLVNAEDEWWRRDINLLLFICEGFEDLYRPIDGGNIRNQIYSCTLSADRVVATVKLFIMFL